MTKRKTLIFSLSAIIFLALSFIVYSWTEPTIMPSSYDPPINTSTNAQTKKGQLKLEEALYAPIVIDRDGCVGESCPYYINPSGNSVLKGGLTTSGNIITINPTQVGHVTTKGYVDGLFSGIEQEISSSNLMYINGTNPSCPEDSVEIMRHYLSKTCGWDSLSCRPGLTSCQTVGDIWVTEGHIPSCTYTTTPDICANLYEATCIASDLDAVICVKN